MNSVSKYFLATRPAFLFITLLGSFIGIAIPSASKASFSINFLALCIALFAHSGGNLLNDYFDHLNGSDKHNKDRITPFTGGSRFIQDQLLKPKAVFHFGVVLIGLSTALGLYICARTTWELISIGIIGVAIAWAYSAPPLYLMSRGVVGEIAIAIAWSLVVIGFASIQIDSMAYKAAPIGLAYGLMVSNILLVNQIPDTHADMLANKMTLATRTNSITLSYWYIGIFIAAYAFQIAGILMGLIPKETVFTLLALPIFAYCSKKIALVNNERGKIKQSIVLNLIAIHLYSLLLLIGLLLFR